MFKICIEQCLHSVDYFSIKWFYEEYMAKILA